MNHQNPLDLDYPNLASCKIKLVGGSAVATSRPPVHLPRAVRISAASAAAAAETSTTGGGDDGDTYDFSLGTCIRTCVYSHRHILFVCLLVCLLACFFLDIVPPLIPFSSILFLLSNAHRHEK